MRALRLVLMIALAGNVGCAITGRPANNAAIKRNPSRTADVEQIAQRVNANTRKIDSLRCDQVFIEGKSQGQIYSITAKLGFQQPNKFRLIGRMMGHKQVDLGANEEEIWLWVKPVDQAVHFCKREDLPRVRLATPFHPDALIEVLGVIEIQPERYRPGEESNHYYSLVTNLETPGGRPIIKRLVFDRATDRLAQIELFDPDRRDQPICRSTVHEYMDDPATGAVLPRRVELLWPEMDTRLVLKLQKPKTEFNTVTPAVAQALFRRDGLDDNPAIDLARVPPRSGGDLRASREAIDRDVQPARADVRAPRAADGDPTTPPKKTTGMLNRFRRKS